jgi:hypothetical protein
MAVCSIDLDKPESQEKPNDHFRITDKLYHENIQLMVNDFTVYVISLSILLSVWAMRVLYHLIATN